MPRIGAVLCANREDVSVSIAPARPHELLSSCREAKRGNVVASARLRRLAGVGSWADDAAESALSLSMVDYW